MKSSDVYLYCAKYASGSKGEKVIYLKQKVKRVCMEICEKGCKKYKDKLDQCEAYWSTLESLTEPEAKAA